MTVYIEAKVDRIVWDMGNGEKVTCYDAGTEYKATGARAGATSPDCGYDKGYPKADTYKVTATTHWTVNWWTNSDATRRVIPQTRRSGIVQIRINELQVVTR